TTLFEIDTDIAVLIAAILTVSGPTVVIPLLRIARPREPSAAILRWEGIVIDPVGATLAIVTLDAILGDGDLTDAILRIATTLGAGTGAGVLVAIVLIVSLERHWVPDHLQNPVTLMAAVFAFTLANQLRPEAGLLATTVLGVVLANQHRVAARHISEFEEDLGALILGGLFIVLGARVDLGEVGNVLLPSLGLVAVLVLVARPLAVLVSTIGSDLRRNDRLFMMWMAPRGIVAAAVAAVFAIELEEARGTEVSELVPIVFTVIVATVIIYGTTTVLVARLTRVARAQPHGIVLVGGQLWVRNLAAALADQEVPVLLVTSDRREARLARRDGLLVFNGRIDSEDLDAAVEAIGIRDALILSTNPELNVVAQERLASLLTRKHIYQLKDEQAESEPGVIGSVIARSAFGAEITHQILDKAFRDNRRLRTVSPEQTTPNQIVLLSLRDNRLSSIQPNARSFGDATTLVVLEEPISKAT
ncbi:MAG: cation:proton antiporter, partial [Acidimicrobiales bacterium]